LHLERDKPTADKNSQANSLTVSMVIANITSVTATGKRVRMIEREGVRE